MFYRELVSEFAALDRSPENARVVFVYQGSTEQGPKFFDGLDPDAVGIADPRGDLFRALAVRRGGWREMFGLRTWLAGARALLRGHFIGRKIGDPWTLPTMFAIRGGRVVWEFRGEHAGDHPDVSALPDDLWVTT